MSSDRPGFTLIELLVVVTVIAMLLAILTPALDKAMDRAVLTVCASHLHGIANGGELYRMDHKRAFPTIRLVGMEPDDVYYTYHYWGGKAGAQQNDKGLGHARLLNPYVGIGYQLTDLTQTGGAVDLFRCPADRGSQGGWGNAYHAGTSYYNWGTSYFYNASGNSNDTSGLYKKKSTVNPPDKVVVASDWPFNAWFMYGTQLQPYCTMYWHNETELGWGNVQFADGHVAFAQAQLVERPGTTSLDFQTGPDYTFLPGAP